jgi:hypothetical protein
MHLEQVENVNFCCFQKRLAYGTGPTGRSEREVVLERKWCYDYDGNVYSCVPQGHLEGEQFVICMWAFQHC